MKELNIVCRVVEQDYNDLTADERDLVDQAIEASKRGYAPYSHFYVGAALQLANGEVVQANNQENAAYPSGMCAERTAAFFAHATFPAAAFERIAIAARDGAPDGPLVQEPISPCGACRQVLIEYEKLAGKPVEVLLVGRAKIYRLPSVRSLLPLAFTEF